MTNKSGSHTLDELTIKPDQLGIQNKIAMSRCMTELVIL